MLNKSVFIFRRDLRLQDNVGLIAAMEASSSVIPVFIVDPLLVSRWEHSVARLSFLAQALQNLDQELRQHHSRLQVLHGDPSEVIENLIVNQKIDGVFINRDYTPVARRRDGSLRDVCKKHGVVIKQYGDQLLNEPESVSKIDGLPYTIFTPFFRKARVLHISAPAETVSFNLEPYGASEPAAPLVLGLLDPYLKHKTAVMPDGKQVILDSIEKLENYDDSKDIPGVKGTSRLSAYLRFGLVSPRQVYQIVLDAHSASHGIIRQLYWRDFYFHIGHHFPYVYHSPFRQKYRSLRWNDNLEGLRLWEEGKTGFPIVDAGMRELAATGYMHNRVRMVVASFLTKNLLLNWQLGEAHFAKHLIDYDPALNNGNWQWSASTGCDAQPYFRVFNPWRQQKRFDVDCSYIKRWIPELENLTAKEIHGLEKTDVGYLPKIVDLKLSAEESKARFKAIGDSLREGG